MLFLEIGDERQVEQGWGAVYEGQEEGEDKESCAVQLAKEESGRVPEDAQKNAWCDDNP